MLDFGFKILGVFLRCLRIVLFIFIVFKWVYLNVFLDIRLIIIKNLFFWIFFIFYILLSVEGIWFFIILEGFVRVNFFLICLFLYYLYMS